MTAPRPWYFKDGSPINAEQIRKIVDRAKAILGTNGAIANSNGNGNDPPYPITALDGVSRKLIVSVAQYFAKQMERHLTKILLSEFESLRRYSVRSSGNASLDAGRQWRRSYMRQYRMRVKAYDERRR